MNTGGNQLPYSVVHKTDPLSSYNRELKFSHCAEKKLFGGKENTAVVTTLASLFFSQFDGVLGNVNSVPTHQHSWQYKNRSQKHFLDSYSNPGPSHHQAREKDLLKGSHDVDNKNTLSSSIKLKS